MDGLCLAKVEMREVQGDSKTLDYVSRTKCIIRV